MSQSKMTTKKFISVTFKVQELEKVHTFVLLVYAVYVTACQNWYLLRAKIALNMPAKKINYSRYLLGFPLKIPDRHCTCTLVNFMRSPSSVGGDGVQ